MIPEYLSLLANHLWQSTIVAGLAALLALTLRKNPARFRYWLWFSASLKFLIPFSMLVSIGHQFDWRTPRALTNGPISVVAQISRPFDRSPVVSVATSAVRSVNPFPVVLVSVWLCGFGVSGWLWLRSWWRVRTAVVIATPMDLDLPIGGMHVRIMSSPTLLEPAVFGVFKPVLLLPNGIATRMPPDQLKAILIHELCHVRRRDNLATAIYMVAETLFWFYPLVRWIGKRLIDERERACDEEVLRLGNEPLVYAEGILHVCKSYLQSPLHCASGVTGSDLKKRIREILAGCIDYDLSFAKKALLAMVGIAAVTVPVALGVLTAPPIRAQNAPAAPKFEVASIRPCQSERQVPGHPEIQPWANSSPGRLSTGCVRLLDGNGIGLIGHAYPELPIQGGPSWIRSAFYEINAKAEGNPSVKMMMGPMMQVLLEDRFHLKMSHQTSEGSVYFLTVARGGAKLHAFTEGSCTPYSAFAPAPLQPGQAYCKHQISMVTSSVEVQGGTLDEFSDTLGTLLERPVINKTGITGRFEIRIEFSREGTKLAAMPLIQPNGGLSATSDTTGRPSIFAALQDQLGLRLESARGPVEAFVIDHIEKPTEN